MEQIQEFISGLSVYNIITIILILLFFLSSAVLRGIRKKHASDPVYQEEQMKKREAYEKRLRDETDSLIEQANAGMDMGDGGNIDMEQ